MVENQIIVYEERNFYLYMHISPSMKRYIGITHQIPENRWKRGGGYERNPHFYNAIKKYGWDNIQHIICFRNLTMSEAKRLEIMFISYYNTTNTNYGYNMMKGGDYGLAPNMYTKERRDKMSEVRTGICMGYEHSSSKEVICLQTLERFGSCGLAALKYNTKPSAISRCCIYHKYHAGYGNGQFLCWLYYDEYLRMSKKDINNILENNVALRLKQQVICLNNLQIFPNKKYIIENYDIHLADSSCLSNACNKLTKTGNRISAGVIGDQRLYWMHLNQYDDLSDEEKIQIKLLYYNENCVFPKKEENK